MLPVFWGPFGPQCSYGLPIHEYVTYLATDVTLHRTTIKDAISLQAMWNSLTLEPFPKLHTLPVFWGLFGPQSSYGLLIHEYVTY